jgi:hypothetical protein
MGKGVSMDDNPKHRPHREAKREAIEAISSIVKHGTKRPSASTHVLSGPVKKARTTTLPPPVDDGAENISPSLHRTPTCKLTASRANLIEQWSTIYAEEIETQIAADAGATRKNIPLGAFRLAYLSDFSVKAEQKLTVKSVENIGEGDWEEQHFWHRLRQSLSNKVRFQTSLSPLLTY